MTARFAGAGGGWGWGTGGERSGCGFGGRAETGDEVFRLLADVREILRLLAARMLREGVWYSGLDPAEHNVAISNDPFAGVDFKESWVGRADLGSKLLRLCLLLLLRRLLMLLLDDSDGWAARQRADMVALLWPTVDKRHELKALNEAKMSNSQRLCGRNVFCDCSLALLPREEDTAQVHCRVIFNEAREGGEGDRGGRVCERW